MVAFLLLLLHPLFGMHFHSSLDLVIPFLLLNLSLTLGFLRGTAPKKRPMTSG